jgi:hypothetical protein
MHNSAEIIGLLEVAVIHNSIDMIELLLNSGMCFDDEASCNAFMLAVRENKVGMERLLLDRAPVGVDIVSRALQEQPGSESSLLLREKLASPRWKCETENVSLQISFISFPLDQNLLQNLLETTRILFRMSRTLC